MFTGHQLPKGLMKTRPRRKTKIAPVILILLFILLALILSACGNNASGQEAEQLPLLTICCGNAIFGAMLWGIAFLVFGLPHILE
ncbi:MAG: hypothetical protein A2418_03080 [Candidatus Brennerbacteria bacterium RIFOXYC1_FULL_41_11]|uniref:Uncharacterized protein n=1 Tax=Candidatus Brennerbacteria bacterium RIFOXYD1_FULL_41_16 TaxID=1797529 RepID=A0A1G1XKB2_9BACT|nr:MAG: hypothetical protein A2391_00685 [Candidatus Brennerbacteria bacterium RIFOXYB1_FULL_41_13]OGY39816.1 MAG: hypothetical protein A2418_03080 [Candidatus Brennerbacteria bacterium RIFOXYC1_FULL_41_11]OGY40585.1 MAG: hypothetical protein A2570_02520 [Candidatus Brennerbacteria bacterium RIFOXYD1_FULL_41_16]